VEDGRGERDLIMAVILEKHRFSTTSMLALSPTVERNLNSSLHHLINHQALLSVFPPFIISHSRHIIPSLLTL